MRSIELTLSADGVFDLLPDLKRQFGGDPEIGVGTVTSGDQARQALDGGDLAALTVRSRQLSALVAEAVQARITR
ncbi:MULTISPECIES: hypothetical protein [unclassified Arthrobacter]|uniref:hypothetical protein n=1 Tax=unclassified Arthrobacter TaxID=235627 RepID=UPI0033965570